jgi:hypothetical protein
MFSMLSRFFEKVDTRAQACLADFGKALEVYENWLPAFTHIALRIAMMCTDDCFDGIRIRVATESNNLLCPTLPRFAIPSRGIRRDAIGERLACDQL